MPIHSYSNWNNRETDNKDQIEPYRKYVFICEGANTETFYFEKLIDLRKELGIHPLIDIRLWEKTEEHKNLSYPKHIVEFAEEQKELPANQFDSKFDKMVIVFDADIFEKKVSGYDELIRNIEKSDIAGVTNPGFEIFLLLHEEDAYKKYIENHEKDFLSPDSKNRYSYPLKLVKKITGINPKKNKDIGNLAQKVFIAIEQEKFINQNPRLVKGRISSNIGKIIESIIKDEPCLQP